MYIYSTFLVVHTKLHVLAVYILLEGKQVVRPRNHTNICPMTCRATYMHIYIYIYMLEVGHSLRACH